MNLELIYQPGGTLLIVAGSAASRAQTSGNNDMGRFCWHALRGKQYEGVIPSTAYRMCHIASDNPGPYTAYTKQHVAKREAEIINPNPQR